MRTYWWTIAVLACVSLGACTTREKQSPATAITEDRPAQAIAYYTAAINANGQDAEAYYHRGTAYSHKGDYNRAIEDYNKALEINPQFPDAYFNRGVAYRHKGEYDRAIEDCNKALEINPEDAAAYLNRGGAYYFQEQWPQARSDWEKAVELDPNGEAGQNAHNNLGVLTEQGH